MIVGEVRCDCGGQPTVAVRLDNGEEWLTDATGTTSADLLAWFERVRERAKDLPQRERLLVGAKALAATFGKLIVRPCPECDGAGWLLRLHQDVPDELFVAPELARPYA